MSALLQNRFPSVAFGTSGVRALVSDLTPDVIAAYVYAFVERLVRSGELAGGRSVAVAMDLRPSSPDIVRTILGTLQSLGIGMDWLGALPTPALALHCMEEHMPGIMVTGSHIPFDRNGIKFYRPTGEILKDDEAAMLATPIPEICISEWTVSRLEGAVSDAAQNRYIRRYRKYFGGDALRGLRVGVYQHSAVGRDLVGTILSELGGMTIPLGRSDAFVPMDTEAVSEADVSRARQWCREHTLDALVSTDGDGDRPLVFDAEGNFIRGDLLGLICARELGIEALAVPVNCNTAIEQSGAFRRVIRTRIGSPYVIAGMEGLLADNEDAVAGFEANGGFLLASPRQGLRALPTRDAILPIAAILAVAVREKKTVAGLAAQLPSRFTYSDRLQNIPFAESHALLARLTEDANYRGNLFLWVGKEINIETIDGIRMTFVDGNCIHLRASGNAPELRCYTESTSYPLAKKLCEETLRRLT